MRRGGGGYRGYNKARIKGDDEADNMKEFSVQGVEMEEMKMQE